MKGTRHPDRRRRRGVRSLGVPSTGSTGLVQFGRLLLVYFGRRTLVHFQETLDTEPLREQGAEIICCDLNDPSSQEAAHEGVDKAVLVLPQQYDLDLFRAYGRNAIDAARKAGVTLLVFNTSTQVPPEGGPALLQVKRELEDYLKQSGIPTVVIRPGFYIENLLGPWTKPAIVQDGVIAYPLRVDFAASWISHADAAALTVAALDRPQLIGQAFDVGGLEALDGDALADRFSQVLGRKFNYVAIPLDAFEQGLAQAFGPIETAGISGLYRWYAGQQHGASDMTALTERFGVQMTVLDDWIRQQDWTQ